MWIFSKFGFFSIVKDLNFPSNVPRWVIRSRTKGDLESLLAWCDPNGGRIVVTTPRSDYRYRASVGPAMLAVIFDNLERSIDYPNFKEMIATSDDQADKIPCYNRIWSVMRTYQEADDVKNQVEGTDELNEDGEITGAFV